MQDNDDKFAVSAFLYLRALNGFHEVNGRLINEVMDGALLFMASDDRIDRINAYNTAKNRTDLNPELLT